MFSLQGWLSGLGRPKASHRESGSIITDNPLSRFGAMAKLVDEGELAELESQAGFDAQLVRRLRLERRRAYGLYLSELVREFQHFEREALDRGANDPGVDPGFLEAVLKVKMRFTISVWLLRAGMWLPSFKWSGTHQRTVNLVGSLKPLMTRHP